jgi:hypothetical protein
MRPRSVALAFVAATAGLTVSAALRRLAGRRGRLTTGSVPTAAAPVAPAVRELPVHEAVVLPFSLRAVAAPVAERPAAPARCGDNGGRTKAGAPCGSRPTAGGRCHHHRVAA